MRDSAGRFPEGILEQGGSMGFRDECGVFGICQQEEASRQTYLGLYALQHRGQEAAGIVTYDGEEFNPHRGLGHVEIR